jgi:hypothetical protein
MAVTVICPNLRCRSVLQVPDNVRGKKVRCGKCGKNFIVPEVAVKKVGAEQAEGAEKS